jgi:hypothetical protein
LTGIETGEIVIVCDVGAIVGETGCTGMGEGTISGIGDSVSAESAAGDAAGATSSPTISSSIGDEIGLGVGARDFLRGGLVGDCVVIPRVVFVFFAGLGEGTAVVAVAFASFLCLSMPRDRPSS